jgi:hypothetical protein
VIKKDEKVPETAVEKGDKVTMTSPTMPNDILKANNLLSDDIPFTELVKQE